ncbi:5-oxoprolinase subunit B family protein [Ruegeria arenilitoris]|uniref:5-oxoprolinase subunit B family protein n=1 Tax=Ruegeria arenilitoris TaxID=1173585 RepID=UPI00147D9A85|nr:carboxyltransferase domain-containing protein [Ruegeria arenilitoris]
MTLKPLVPQVRTVGIDGILVTFADKMSEDANRAALALRSEIENLNWNGVEETSTSLASTYIRIDTAKVTHADISNLLRQVLDARDWHNAPLPSGRKLWRVPTVYGTDLAPQLDETAKVAGFTPEEAIARLSRTRVRVLTIGFAPGQPYLGPLGPEFDIPRLKDLTPMVPEGALVLAISQLVLFSGPKPTGWRHVGQTAFRCFRPEAEKSFALNPGDEMLFEPITKEQLIEIQSKNSDGSGGAICEDIDA